MSPPAPALPPVTEELLRALPKTDLHCHLDGSLRLATQLELAAREEVRLPARQQLERGGEDNFILREVLGGAGEIDRDVAVVQGVVKKLKVLPLMALLLHSAVKAPIILPLFLPMRFRPKRW